jgi:uncharacterized protein YjeT (DUF2065 family)
MTEDAATEYSRLAGLTLVASGVVHAVEFRPGEGSKRRVRLVGLAMAATGAHLLYHGGVRPRGFD